MLKIRKTKTDIIVHPHLVDRPTSCMSLQSSCTGGINSNANTAIIGIVSSRADALFHLQIRSASSRKWMNDVRDTKYDGDLTKTKHIEVHMHACNDMEHQYFMVLKIKIQHSSGIR